MGQIVKMTPEGNTQFSLMNELGCCQLAESKMLFLYKNIRWLKKGKTFVNHELKINF